jgi:hypothetical protein
MTEKYEVIAKINNRIYSVSKQVEISTDTDIEAQIEIVKKLYIMLGDILKSRDKAMKKRYSINQEWLPYHVARSHTWKCSSFADSGKTLKVSLYMGTKDSKTDESFQNWFEFL